MIAPTRRALLGGAIAATAAPALAHARGGGKRVSLPAEFKAVRRGRAIAVAPRSGKLIVAHDRLRSIAVIGGGRKRIVDVGGQPLEVAASPDGRLAAVTTASWDEPGLAIVDLRSGKVERLDAGTAPFGVAFSGDSRRIVVAGGEENGEARVLDARTLKAKRRTPLGDCPRAVAPAAGGEGVWIALNGPDRVVLVNGEGRIARSVSTPPLPDRVAASRDGKRLLISHAGPGSERVSELSLRSAELRRHKAGRQPSGVAWTRRGRAVVAIAGAGQIVVIAPGEARSRHVIGGSPRGIAVAGDQAWTVDALTGRVSKVRV